MSEATSNLNISRAFGLGEDELTLFLENNAIFSSIVARILGAKMGREVDAFAGKSTLQSPSIFSGVMNDFFRVIGAIFVFGLAFFYTFLCIFMPIGVWYLVINL